ncbi:MAG: FkbM family methyltransferase [Limisphaerales bacterium]
MSFAGELRRIAERLDTPDARPARRMRIPLPLYRMFNRIRLLTPVNTILDVGANIGEFSEWVAKFWPEAKIHAFEPLPCCLSPLQQVAARHPQVSIHEFALGEKSGEAEMFENEFSPSSSLLPMTDRHREIWPKTAKDKPVNVPIRTLDAFVEENQLSTPTLLKLDVQGFEINVLRGASKALKNVAVILSEVQFDAFYEDQTDFLDLQILLKEHGFRFLEFADERRLNEEHRLVYADAVFVRHELRFP